MQANCSLYAVAAKPPGETNMTCTLAANYNESRYDVVAHVTSFTRKEHSCRLRGTRALLLFIALQQYNREFALKI